MTTCPARGVDFYVTALETLIRAQVPFLVGGAYAFERYTGIARDTKDLDVFVRPEDCERTLAAFAATGCRTDLTHPHWLGKVLSGDEMLDVIFSSGNGCAKVDEEWFTHAVAGQVFGMPVRLSPPEEMIWSKAYIMERERYDGADIAHLIRACGARLDWGRLLRRFGPHWRVLLSHLVLFGFIYPAERAAVPPAVLRALLRRLERDLERPPDTARVCFGTLLSRAQYLVDVETWQYTDARLLPKSAMTEEDIAGWTAAIEGERPTASAA